MNTKIALLLILIAIAGGVYAIARGKGTPATSKEPGVCTADAKLCGDGSYVNRVAPNCEFAQCPTSSGKGARPVGVLIGTVTTSPTCPVERIPPEPQCAPRPYATDIAINGVGSDGPSVVTQSDERGYFSVILYEGTYLVRAQSHATLPRCGEQTVTVIASATTSIAIDCDSGIR